MSELCKRSNELSQCEFNCECNFLSYRFTNLMLSDNNLISHPMMHQYFVNSQGLKVFFDILE